MTDNISDMLTRIKNALAVNKKAVVVPYSKVNMGIAQILGRRGFIEGYEKEGYGVVITLAYSKKGRPAIKHLKRISKPGRRIYEGATSFPLIYGRKGVVIVSTSKGLMPARKAIKQGLGGEVICEVW